MSTQRTFDEYRSDKDILRWYNTIPPQKRRKNAAPRKCSICETEEGETVLYQIEGEQHKILCADCLLALIGARYEAGGGSYGHEKVVCGST